MFIKNLNLGLLFINLIVIVFFVRVSVSETKIFPNQTESGQPNNITNTMIGTIKEKSLTKEIFKNLDNDYNLFNQNKNFDQFILPYMNNDSPNIYPNHFYIFPNSPFNPYIRPSNLFQPLWPDPSQ